MNSKRTIIVRWIMHFLPETSCFSLKSALWRWAGADIGKNVRICSSVTIMGSGILKIGDNTWIGHQVMIITGSKILIGKNVDIGPRVYIGTGTHKINMQGNHTAGEGVQLPVVIQDGAWICVNATLLPGITVGFKSVVAAGALVNLDVPAKTLVAGVPAKQIKLLDSERQ